ncbi:NADP-dependent oxidoreductase domain-containing protein [Aspergillus venezuelensis]
MSSNRRLILGLMTIGPDAAAGARITSLDEFKQCLDYFSMRGYHKLDTAAKYIGGEQEAFTRETRFMQRGFAIASKIMPLMLGGHAPRKLIPAWDRSLHNLGVDSTDIFYLHAPDRATPNYAAWEIAEMGFIKPTIYQAMYNAIARAIEEELEPCLRKFGVSLVIYNPLAAGLFSGKYTTLDKPAEGRFTLSIIEPFAKKHGIPYVEVGLRWCVHDSRLRTADTGGNDGVILVISSYAQLVQNFEVREKDPLPEAVVAAMDEAWRRARGDAPTYWR